MGINWKQAATIVVASIIAELLLLLTFAGIGFVSRQDAMQTIRDDIQESQESDPIA